MYKKDNIDFISDVKRMTKQFGQPFSEKPTFLGKDRIENFKSVISEEIREVDLILAKLDGEITEEQKIETLTDLSDWLGDIVVYCTNEAVKHGIPLDAVVEIIMESNFSKFWENGEARRDERGKFLKGPNYWKPEPKIRELLERKIKEHQNP